MIDQTTRLIEALLFVSTEPRDSATLALASGVSIDDVEVALRDLTEHYVTTGHGIRVETSASGVRLVTAPEAGPCITALRGSNRPSRLSVAALDVLAIVAYKQPVTRLTIESIRGVSSDHVLAILLNHGVIEEIGRADSIGRPILYGTTPAFLQAAGLTSLADLPPLSEAQTTSA
jgi:segregation and condensation protein B